VASVVEEFTMRRFVMVEVPVFTMMPPEAPLKVRRVVVASPGNGHVKPPVLKSVPHEKTPPDHASLPVVGSQAASPSAKSLEVEATFETDNVVEVALVVVPEVERRLVMVALVAERTEAKSEVEVAFEVVALSAVKFCSVVEAKVMRPPQNCDAVVEVETRYATVGEVEAESAPFTPSV
jgi:hypothetical protein